MPDTARLHASRVNQSREVSRPDGSLGRAVLIAGAVKAALTFVSLTMRYLLPTPVLVALALSVLVAAAWVFASGRYDGKRDAAAGLALVVLPWAFVGYFLSVSDG